MWWEVFMGLLPELTLYYIVFYQLKWNPANFVYMWGPDLIEEEKERKLKH